MEKGALTINGSRSFYRYLLLCFGLSVAINVQSSTQDPTAAELIELELEDLVSMEIEVESAGKTQTKAFDLPYAGQVVTAEEIKRYNILSIPEALRFIPGVQSEQIGGSEWGVSLRGSGGRFSRFVLVLLDGRALNNIVFSGINWDEVDVSIGQVKRIEVIRGPNADSWGANAVNGIINIITFAADEQKGGSLRFAGGSDSLLDAELTYNFDIGNDWFSRVSISKETLPGLSSLDRLLIEDESEISRASYRLNHKSNVSDFQLSLAFFDSDIFAFWLDYQLPEVSFVPNVEEKSAHYLQSKWTFQKSEATEVRTRFSYDNKQRRSPIADWDSKNIQLDLDIQQRYQFHTVNFGVNFRKSESEFIPTQGFPLSMTNDMASIDYSGLYFSETFQLPKHGISLKVGGRLDHNTLTGYEFQPSARILWKVDDDTRFWFAASEAASIPSVSINNAERAYLDYFPASEINSPYPLLLFVQQKQSLKNTRVNAMELGVRYLWANANIDISLFKSEYSQELQLRNVGEPQLSDFPPSIDSYLIQFLTFNSLASYQATGLEISYLSQINKELRLQGNVSLLDTENAIGVKSLYAVRVDYEWNDKWNTNLMYRYSSGNELFDAQTYGVFDFNLNYQVTNNLRVSLSAKNYGESSFEEGRREYFSPGVLVNEPRQTLNVSWDF